MSSFTDGLDDRRKALEDKFVHDEELRFRAESHARHAFGRWVATQAKMKPAEAEAYPHTLADDLRRSEAEVKFMAQGDLTARGVHLSDHALDIEFEKCRAAGRAHAINGA